jgi:glycosyltransferase involved in cell wall biosynthesis
MKILHLEASPGWGGQEIRILREAEGMRSRGHNVILCVMKGGRLIAEACKAGFTTYEINFHKRSWPIAFMRLLAIMRRHRIDIVNTHSSLDSWIGGLAARAMRIPIVRTRHLSTAIRPGLNSRILYGWLADYVVTTCAQILPMIAIQSRKPSLRMRSIPTGVDPGRMKFSESEAQKFRRSLNLGAEDFLVGTACFMRSWKGINDFLEAAHILRGQKNLRWVIIGGGHEDEYRKRAADLNLGSVVHFTGHLANPIFAIAALDAFALLSTAHEGVSQAILQAAYLGKPLIATSTGGLCEVCLDGKTGVTVDPFSPLQVAEAVEKLMKERKLCNMYGENARNLAFNHFTLERTLDQMEEVYCQIVGSHLE